MSEGKPTGVRCIQLGADNHCLISLREGLIFFVKITIIPGKIYNNWGALYVLVVGKNKLNWF